MSVTRVNKLTQTVHITAAMAFTWRGLGPAASRRMGPGDVKGTRPTEEDDDSGEGVSVGVAHRDPSGGADGALTAIATVK